MICFLDPRWTLGAGVGDSETNGCSSELWTCAFFLAGSCLFAQSPCYLLTYQEPKDTSGLSSWLERKSALYLKKNRTASPWLLLFALLVSDDL